jgi:hypothetical protein
VCRACRLGRERRLGRVCRLGRERAGLARLRLDATLRQVHMPLMLGVLRNIVPSLPLFVSPRHWFAGNGGLPRVVYRAEVCLTHRPLRDPELDLLVLDLLVLDAALGLDRPFDLVLQWARVGIYFFSVLPPQCPIFF